MATNTLHSNARRGRGSRAGRLTRGLMCLAALAGGLAAAQPAAVHAATTVVGSGTAGSCTTNDASSNDGPAGLSAAVAAGGVVTFACGGGPVTIPGNLTITQDVTIDGTGQRVTIDGGGFGSVIAVTGPTTVNLTALALVHGHATLSGGAGIYNAGPATIYVTDSTIAANDYGGGGGGGGGGILNAGILEMSDSTVAGNTAARGGGILNGGTLEMSGSTVAGNTAPYGGGGILNDPGDTLTLADSILGGNSAATRPDCSGSLTSGGHNLIQDTAGCAGAGPTDLTGVGPALGPLAHNGGPTQTMALLPGSPAIGLGYDCVDTGRPNTPATDQRGFGRPHAPATCDAGAYEYAGTPLTLALALAASPDGAVTTGSSVTATVTVGNYTATTQTVALALALTSQSHQTSTRTATLILAPGQVQVHAETYAITMWSPRGGYSLAVTATDSSADTRPPASCSWPRMV